MQYHLILVIFLYCKKTFFSVLAFKLIDKITKNVKQFKVCLGNTAVCICSRSVNETEFMLLYDANKSRETYPYWNFERFDLENFDDAQSLTDFRIRKNNIFV